MLFSQIAGLQELKQHILHLFQHQRLAHAYLLLGNDGWGALSVAMAMAQYAVCSNPHSYDACGSCAACVKAQKLIHPDIHFTYPVVGSGELSSEHISKWREAFIANPYLNEAQWLQMLDTDNKQGNISAKECAAIIKNLSFKSFESTYKIQIIWKAERLQKDANRLLKTIEEPEGNTLILMVASDVRQILPTVLSRVQMLRLTPLADEEVSDYLQKKHQMSTGAAVQAALGSNGEISTALWQGSHETHNELLLQWLQATYAHQPENFVRWAETMAKLAREQQKNWLRYALFFVEESCRLRWQLASRLPEGDTLKWAQRLAAFPLEETENLSALLNKSVEYTERNAHAKILFFNLSIQLSTIFAKQKIAAKT